MSFFILNLLKITYRLVKSPCTTTTTPAWRIHRVHTPPPAWRVRRVHNRYHFHLDTTTWWHNDTTKTCRDHIRRHTAISTQQRRGSSATSLSEVACGHHHLVESAPNNDNNKCWHLDTTATWHQCHFTQWGRPWPPPPFLHPTTTTTSDGAPFFFLLVFFLQYFITFLQYHCKIYLFTKCKMKSILS